MRLSRTGSRWYLLEDVVERDRATGVGPLLEAAKCLVERRALERESLVGARTRERVPAGVLAERERHALPDGRRIDDLVGALVLQHPVLVQPGLVGERVRPRGR